MPYSLHVLVAFCRAFVARTRLKLKRHRGVLESRTLMLEEEQLADLRPHPVSEYI